MKPLLLLLSSAAFAASPHIVFVCGDHEYSGELTMPILAQALEKQYGFKTTVLNSMPDRNGEFDIPGLEALRKADLAIFNLRWRQLPKEQVAYIDEYVKSGKPIFAFRTSSHSFNYPKGHELEAWNRWASVAFGAPPGWGGDGHTHFGHQASTDVRIIPEQKNHPILTGVAPTFHVRGWLYRVLPKWPPPDAVQLLMGKAVDPNKPAEDNPIAWTWKNQWGGRTFYTSLGHPEDFEVESAQRVTLNAIHWLLGKKPAKFKGMIPIHVPYRGMVKTR